MILIATLAAAVDMRVSHVESLTWAATGIVLAEWDGEFYPVLFNDAQLEVRDANLAVVASLATGAVAVAVRDDLVGRALWLCSSDGVRRAPWPEIATIEEPELILDTPCLAVAPILDGIVTSDGRTWHRWFDDGLGGVYATDDLELPSSGSPLASGNHDLAAVGDIGGSSLGLVSVDGTASVATAGTLAGVTIIDGTAWWTTAEPPAVATNRGWYEALGAAPGAIVPAALGPGYVDDVVVVHPSRGVVSLVRDGATPVEGMAAVGWTGPAVSIPRWERCSDTLALADAGQSLVVASVMDCDDDGYTVVGGDCDDLDDSTWPAGTEACDGLDHDCDGVPDFDAGDWLPAEAAAIEGTIAELWWRDGCFADKDVRVTVAPPSAPANCTPRSDHLACAGDDDAGADITVEVYGEDGTLLDARPLHFIVLNVAPELAWDEPLAQPSGINLDFGVTEERRIDVVDPGTDVVTCTLAGAPAGLTLDADCTLRWKGSEADVGEYQLTVTMSDDDGGSTVYEVPLTVGGTDDESGGCCTGAAAVLCGVGFLRHRQRRRRLGSA